MTTSRTIHAVVFESLRQHDRPARMLQWTPRGIAVRSARGIAAEVREVSLGLAASGIAPGDRVAILSYNRPEWALADYAILSAGAVTVPIYSTLPAEAVEFILRDSGARAVFVEDANAAQKVLQRRSNLPDLATVVSFQTGGDLTWDDLRARSRALPPEEHDRRAAQVRPEDLATLIYTSGTTGTPKGVMLTHANIVSNLEATVTRIPFGSADVAISFLPLSHVFERLVDYGLMATGATIAYARSIEQVADDLLLYRPTVMAAVPRFFEKVRDRILAHVATLPDRRRKAFDWALSVGRETVPYRVERRPLPAGLRMRHLVAERLVLRKLRERTGGRVRFFISGGAPLPREVNEFFWALGLPILEGYGLTETSPVISVNTPEACRIGTVGRPIPGVEVRIAEDGEILVRGPNVMRGYWNRPQETAEVLRDGWFHTGDIGELDADGYLRITDRKKDLIKTAGGKFIAPQPIENALRQSPYIANAVVFGDGRKYAVALLVPNREILDRETAASNGAEREARIREILGREVARVNERLARYETIKRFAVVEREFTIEGGELTPTMKVRRRIVEERYRDVVDALYREGP